MNWLYGVCVSLLLAASIVYGHGGHLAGETSDTESADVHPKIKKTAFTSVFKKKNDKVSTEDAPQQLKDAANGEDKEGEGDEEEEEGARVVLNPPNSEEGVVYAELNLNLQTAARPPPVRPTQDDKTEYAEIIHNKEGGSSS